MVINCVFICTSIASCSNNLVFSSFNVGWVFEWIYPVFKNSLQSWWSCYYYWPPSTLDYLNVLSEKEHFLLHPHLLRLFVCLFSFEFSATSAHLTPWVLAFDLPSREGFYRVVLTSVLGLSDCLSRALQMVCLFSSSTTTNGPGPPFQLFDLRLSFRKLIIIIIIIITTIRLTMASTISYNVDHSSLEGIRFSFRSESSSGLPIPPWIYECIFDR